MKDSTIKYIVDLSELYKCWCSYNQIGEPYIGEFIKLLYEFGFKDDCFYLDIDEKEGCKSNIMKSKIIYVKDF